MKKKIIFYLLPLGVFNFISCKWNIFWMLFYYLENIGLKSQTSFIATLLTFVFIQAVIIFIGYRMFKHDFKCNDELKQFFSIATFCIAITLFLFSAYDCYFEKMYCITKPVPIYITEDMASSIEVEREAFPKHIEVDGTRGKVLIINKDNIHWKKYAEAWHIQNDLIKEIYIPKVYVRSYSYVF